MVFIFRNGRNIGECGKSSTWREISAILFALQSFLPLLRGFYVKWFPDGQNACKITQVGSIRSDLHAITLEVFLILHRSWHRVGRFSGFPVLKSKGADYISRTLYH